MIYWITWSVQHAASSCLIRVADSDPICRAEVPLDIHAANIFGAIAKLMRDVYAYHGDEGRRSVAREAGVAVSTWWTRVYQRLRGTRRLAATDWLRFAREIKVISRWIYSRNRATNIVYLFGAECFKFRDCRRRHTSSRPLIFLFSAADYAHLAPDVYLLLDTAWM